MAGRLARGPRRAAPRHDQVPTSRPAGYRATAYRRLRLEVLETRHLLSGFWTNDFNRLDVNDDGFVLPIDVLNVVNHLTAQGSHVLADPPAGVSPQRFVDVNQDGSVSPLDGLIVINHLNLGLESGTIALGELDGLASQATRTLELGQTQGTRFLRFEVATRFDLDATGPGGSGGSEATLSDMLLIYLVDAGDPSRTLLDRGIPGTALLALGDGRAEFPPEIVTFDGRNVEIDLTSLAEPGRGMLVVQLLNHDPERRGRALLQALTNETDPDGTSDATLPAAGRVVESGGPLNMDWLLADEDLEVLVENVRFDPRSAQYAADIRVSNHGPDVDREVAVVFADLPSQVRMFSASQVSGDPYVNLRDAIPAGGLRSGETSLPVTIRLENPSGVSFGLHPRVLAPDPVTTTRVSGQVRDGQGDPVAGVLVSLAGYSATTIADGSFLMEMPSTHVPTAGYDIAVPMGDPMFDPAGQGDEMIPMHRALGDPATGNAPENPLRHPNMITPYLDASMVYGSDDARAASLRTLDGSGRLKVSADDLLPLNNSTYFPQGTLGIDNPGPLTSDQLFAAGDVRASENPGLTALHTLFVREHNRKAGQIASQSPELTGDEIYQQARRWVGALIQHITYNEFLPMLLGPEPLPAYTGFDPHVDPRVGGLFSTGVYRLGHSLATDTLLRLDEQGESLAGGPLAMRDAFFNSQPLLTDGIEPYLRGMAAQAAEELDASVVDSLRNFLFGPPGAGGLDLVSLNIQRGRDMGLPTYNQLREELGLEPAMQFADVTSRPDLQQQLAAAYGDVDQVDVWVGGLAEEHLPGAMLGETFHAVVRRQFLDIRDGDRFWYENGQLSAEDLSAVRGTRLSDVVRANSEIASPPANMFTLATPPVGIVAGGSSAEQSITEFRALDGHGNHPDQPSLGMAGEQLKMDYQARFADQMAAPAGTDRPSARQISNTVFAQNDSRPAASGATSLLTIWGQFVDHDISLTPSGKDDLLIVHGDLLVDPLPVFSQRLETLLGRTPLARFNNVVVEPIVLD
jgi:hypothetical protein